MLNTELLQATVLNLEITMTGQVKSTVREYKELSLALSSGASQKVSLSPVYESHMSELFLLSLYTVGSEEVRNYSK